MPNPKPNFCNNYFLIDLNEATILELFLLLFSSDPSQRKFISAPPEYLESSWDFPSRLVICLTVVIQKLLIFFKKPLALTGDFLDFCLNLISVNGGLFAIICRIITCRKLEWPDKTSATYRSVAAFTDTRTQLDHNMSVGSDEYKSMLSIMAAKLSYESSSFISSVIQKWNMGFLGFYNCYNAYEKGWATQAFMFKVTTTTPNLIVISFRGTQPFDADDWCTDFDIQWYELKPGRVHAGFMRALGLQKDGWPKEIEPSEYTYAYYTLREKIRDIFKKDETSKFIVIGHSLGGALAALFPAVLAIHDEDELLKRLEGVYTFGQPRVGDEMFGEFMKEKVIKKYNVKYERYVYCNDMVPRVPPDDKILRFKHFGPCLYYNSLYQGQVREEPPNKNSFSLIWFIPMLLNAVWELIRSFIMEFWKGPDYKEGWFSVLCRLMGLVVQGVSDHLPRDYVNSTRLRGLPQ